MVAAANGVQVAIESVIESNTAKRQAKKEKKKGEEMQIDSSAEEQQGKEKKLRPEFGKVQIVPLDQGAERILADALGLRRVAVIGISVGSLSFPPCLSILLTLLSVSLCSQRLLVLKNYWNLSRNTFNHLSHLG
jgi:hypothetical protein